MCNNKIPLLTVDKTLLLPSSGRGRVVGSLFPAQQLYPQLPWLLFCPPFPGHIRVDSNSSRNLHSALGSGTQTHCNLDVKDTLQRFGDFRKVCFQMSSTQEIKERFDNMKACFFCVCDCKSLVLSTKPQSYGVTRTWKCSGGERYGQLWFTLTECKNDKNENIFFFSESDTHFFRAALHFVLYKKWKSWHWFLQHSEDVQLEPHKKQTKKHQSYSNGAWAIHISVS